MAKVLAVIVGVLAWCGVGGIAILMVEFFADDNQVLAYFPILAAVVAAWAIGEVVTERVFDAHEEA